MRASLQTVPENGQFQLRLSLDKQFTRRRASSLPKPSGHGGFLRRCREIGFLDPNDPSFFNQWELFGTYLDALADHAEGIVLDKWLHLLGGADVFTNGHCLVMVESIRVDDNAVADGL